MTTGNGTARKEAVKLAVAIWLVVVGTILILFQGIVASTPNDKIVGLGVSLIVLSGLVKRPSIGNGS